MDDGPKVFIILIAFAAYWGRGQEFGIELIISGVMALGAFWILIDGLRAGRRFKELIEFRDKHKINGIITCKIDDDYKTYGFSNDKIA
jgi:hypothetical protein